MSLGMGVGSCCTLLPLHLQGHAFFGYIHDKPFPRKSPRVNEVSRGSDAEARLTCPGG